MAKPGCLIWFGVIWKERCQAGVNQKIAEEALGIDSNRNERLN